MLDDDDANETDDDDDDDADADSAVAALYPLPPTQTPPDPEMHADFTKKSKWKFSLFFSPVKAKKRKREPSNRYGTGNGVLGPFGCFFNRVVIRGQTLV